VVYLASSQAWKEDVARAIAARERITSALVCVLNCVEPCGSVAVRRNRNAQRRELVSGERKCLYLYPYHYLIYPLCGFMHARRQAWFPFSLQGCLNGREWLPRQMEAGGLAYRRQDNCFPGVKDFGRRRKVARAIAFGGSQTYVIGWSRFDNRLGIIPMPRSVDHTVM